jgi:hypothetical protein
MQYCNVGDNHGSRSPTELFYFQEVKSGMLVGDKIGCRETWLGSISP